VISVNFIADLKRQFPGGGSKAWMIWRSIDPHTGKFRKERFLKAVR
jgi:hypothetical protein